MGINNQYAVLDGIAPSWADIVIKCKPYNGPLIEIYDIAALNTGTTLEVGEQRGASGGRVMKHTTGSVSSEASITFYRSGYQKFLRMLAALAPVRGNERLLSLVHFDIQVQHTPPGDEEIYEYRVKGCRWGGRTKNHAEGTDAEQVECPLIVKKVVDIIDGLECVVL
jgi:hypothetical protein